MERENYILTAMRIHVSAKEDLRTLSFLTKKSQNELFRQALSEFLEKEKLNNEQFLKMNKNLKILND